MRSQAIHLRLDHQSEDTYQAQLRKGLLNAIDRGSLTPERPLPSCRKFAEQLGISRNTVAIVYQQLVNDGYVEARPKSGYYLAESVFPSSTLHVDRLVVADLPEGNPGGTGFWTGRLATRPSEFRQIEKPTDWRRFDYPFIYGQYDTGMFPLSGWRDTVRRLLRTSSDRDWLNDQVDRDDPFLVEQLRRRVLPRRGIFAGDQEVLITLGSQNGLYLLGALLARPGTAFGIENPCYRDAHNILAWHGASPVLHGIDQQGFVPNAGTADCQLLYLTPSHQVPTGIRMSEGRRRRVLDIAHRHDQILIEDDYDGDLVPRVDAPPALKADDRAGRVVYLGSFSKALSPGLRLGYIVADKALIDELRLLRRLMYRHPPTGLQRQVAEFLALGHHDTLVRQLVNEASQRREKLRAGLETHAGLLRALNSPDAGAFWCALPRGADGAQIVAEAARHGVLVEAGDSHFVSDPPPSTYLRLGYTAITRDSIDPGIRRLASIIERHCQDA